MTDALSLLACPVCQDAMTRADHTLRCGRGHSYDIAKEGYINLLLANQKASSSPGDTKAMAASRRAFLGQGYYEPLSDTINTFACGHWPGNETADIRILDAGCGEGYYLHQLMEALPKCQAGYGLDISKEAVKLGAARYKAACFVVASIHQTLPFADASLDFIVNVFAPRNPIEFARVLRPGGRVIIVVPAEEHLAELHDALGLPRIDGGKERRAAEEFAQSLTVSHVEDLRYRRLLPPEDIFHLIRMTPTYWLLSSDAQAGIGRLPSLDIEFAFTLIVLEHASQAATGNE